MILYQRIAIHITFLLGLIFSSSQAIAMEDEFSDSKTKINTQRPSIKRNLDLAALLNLDSLDGLKGQGQVIGIIESGGIKHTPPGLEGTLLNILEGRDDKEHHSALVCQVVASQIPGIGLAPETQVILAAPQAKTEGIILVNIDDAIKWAVRKGAQAINLSIKQSHSKNQKLWIGSKHKSLEGKATYDFLDGIQYALNHGIPVFTSAGNDKEDLLDDKCLKSIWKAAKLSTNPHLFFVVGGFDYPRDICSREDITFSENSGRARQQVASNFFVTGPYKVKAYTPISLEERLARLKKFRFRFDAFELKDIWIKELKEKLATINNADLTQNISTCLARLETYFKLIDTIQFQRLLSKLQESAKDTLLESDVKIFLCNFHGLISELMTGELHVKAEERAKLESLPNYDPRIANGIFEESILHVDPLTKKPADAAFEEGMVEGTSFASPAIAAVYLKLRQYTDLINLERGTTLLVPEDIAVAMKATAYNKPAFEENEEPEWYGCGVIDGETTFTLCKTIVQARQAFQDKCFREGIKLWKTIFSTLRDKLPTKYYFEVLQGLKASEEFQQEHVLRDFSKEMLSYYPITYPSHASDRLEAFSLYEKGEYMECKKKLSEILNKLGTHEKNGSIEVALFKDPNLSWVRGVFFPAEARITLWLNSFLTCEKMPITELKDIEGKVSFLKENNHREAYKLNLAVREGNIFLNKLLDLINVGWDKFDSFDPLEQYLFLDPVKNLSKTLELVDLPSQIALNVQQHSEKAQKLYNEQEKKRN